ncbi:MAG: GGDEF domain-containing protein [Actinobacteria bacterium]|nr:GGDEF domain-containing protein [Actinomycetota bacterium]
MSPAGDDSALEATLAAIRATLRSGRRASLPAGLAANAQLDELLNELADLHRFTLAVSQGDLEQPLTARGSLAGALKTLDAALRHLTWQTQRVAAGDFTQRVDFMGDFSEAFNSMVVALDEARTELEAQKLKLEELATTDTLTGAYNRRKFNDLTLVELERARRYEHPLSLLILDIDHFKHVNDTYGHEAGDEVLVVLAGLMRAGIRATDSLARWGGEEFVVLSPGVTVEGAAELAERLRVAAGTYEHASSGTVTVSIGVAQYRPGETPDELFARADLALFRAKEGGRDRVELAR